jgi:transcriptional regulator with XRE-family HTH domain
MIIVPAKSPAVTEDVANNAAAIGKRIREHRKSLRVSATAAAQAAGMSRITWYRLGKGEPSVTMGAYLSAVNVLGLEVRVVSPSTPDPSPSPSAAFAGKDCIPIRIELDEYPQLKQLAWQIHSLDKLTPQEALGIYERNWRHLDLEAMEPHERHLIDALRKIFAHEVHDV